MKPLLLLDFDSTLIKTYDFWLDFAKIFASVSGQLEDAYTEHYDDFTKGKGLTACIDYDKMISDSNLAEESVRLAAKEQMTKKSYLFDDAKDLLKDLPIIQKKYDVAILTFGQPHFQNLKIEHTPEISGIPIYITQQLKTKFIHDNFMNRPYGVLVDDKPNQALPIGWTEIYIDRNSKKHMQPINLATDVIRITNLKDVLSCI